MAKRKLTVTASIDGETESEALVIDQDTFRHAASVNKLTEKYTIQKIKLKDLFPEVEYSERLADGTNDVSKKCSAPVHNDLKEAFSRLDRHLTSLCNQFDDEGSLNHKQCFCTGFSINGDNTGVVLIGRRNFDDGGGINLVSPFSSWGDNSEVQHIIEQIKQEMVLYLFEGKHAPDQQLDLFDDEAFTD